jgi:hypothetical protein
MALTLIHRDDGSYYRLSDKVIDDRTPLGLPSLWFSPVLPSWAIWGDDKAYHTWVDVPNLNNVNFKNFLTAFSDNGWMTAYDDVGFYVPDLRGMFPRFAGTSATRGAKYAGDDVGAYNHDAIMQHAHFLRVGQGIINPPSQGNSGVLYVNYSTVQGATTLATSSGNAAEENRPVSFSIRLIIRFE